MLPTVTPAIADMTTGVASALVLLGIAVHLGISNRPIGRTAFIVDPPGGLRDGGVFARASTPRPPFRQTKYRENARMWLGPLWEPVMRNEGNVRGMANIPMRPSPSVC